MKIGILTFHEGINHGAYFQAYALYSFFKARGYEVEIINYKNKIHWLHELKAFLWTKNPKNLYKNISKILKFKKAHQRFKLTKFTTNVKNIKALRYDVIVVGSDTVWNYEWSFLGSDPIYFGEGLTSKKIISFAPSCGFVNLNNKIPDFVREGLKNFDYITVRDEHTSNLVKKAIGFSPEIVLDPTFIFDVKGEEVGIEEEKPYILVYAYTLKEKEMKSALNFAKENELLLISIGYHNSWCDKNIVDIGPFEWLSYFKNAEYVLTSTFHGSIFSIKYEKNFVISDNKNIRDKLHTILRGIGLSDRVVSNSDISKIFDQPSNPSIQGTN